VLVQDLAYHTVRERSEAIWRKAGLEPADLQLHEARHTYRTLLAAAGIPRDRRDRYTGHSDPTVGGRYEHQLDGQYLDDAQTFGEYLRRADAPTRIAAEAMAGGSVLCGDAGTRLAKRVSAQRSGAGVEPTQPGAARPHRF
jgi:hypothetical protein